MRNVIDANSDLQGHWDSRRLDLKILEPNDTVGVCVAEVALNGTKGITFKQLWSISVQDEKEAIIERISKYKFVQNKVCCSHLLLFLTLRMTEQQWAVFYKINLGLMLKQLIVDRTMRNVFLEMSECFKHLAPTSVRHLILDIAFISCSPFENVGQCQRMFEVLWTNIRMEQKMLVYSTFCLPICLRSLLLAGDFRSIELLYHEAGYLQKRFVSIMPYLIHEYSLLPFLEDWTRLEMHLVRLFVVKWEVRHMFKVDLLNFDQHGLCLKFIRRGQDQCQVVSEIMNFVCSEKCPAKYYKRQLVFTKSVSVCSEWLRKRNDAAIVEYAVWAFPYLDVRNEFLRVIGHPHVKSLLLQGKLASADSYVRDCLESVDE